MIQLINSGLVSEVHKFSKYIHGCAVLLRDDVIAYPYWLDDPSLRKSIEESGAGEALQNNPGANKVYSHLLAHNPDMTTKVRTRVNTRGLVPRGEDALSQPVFSDLYGSRDQKYDGQNPLAGRDGRGLDEEIGIAGTCGEFMGNNFSCCEHAQAPEASDMVLQKVEPKLLFANERTFIKWLHMVCTIH